MIYNRNCLYFASIRFSGFISQAKLTSLLANKNEDTHSAIFNKYTA